MVVGQVVIVWALHRDKMIEHPHSPDRTARSSNTFFDRLRRLTWVVYDKDDPSAVTTPELVFR
jgi:hypothetical protein